ncbi:AP2/B3-like transcriptional factor family protein [Prunus dulcis]|uniref:AP2/B3-like transcriptional factor family protein n=1 Tax=Prunus dulcis TaxID=3755 RepID=A0A4Y1RUL9_PRUDU|nr:AP2/B3-like transcriptional factor family protein [Prunus dulcis]
MAPCDVESAWGEDRVSINLLIGILHCLNMLLIFDCVPEQRVEDLRAQPFSRTSNSPTLDQGIQGLRGGVSIIEITSVEEIMRKRLRRFLGRRRHPATTWGGTGPKRTVPSSSFHPDQSQPPEPPVLAGKCKNPTEFNPKFKELDLPPPAAISGDQADGWVGIDRFVA